MTDSPTRLFQPTSASILSDSSTTFSVGKANTIEPISQEEVSSIINANYEFGEASIDSTTSDLFATVEKGDAVDPNTSKEPKTFSLQPIAEAYKIAGGTTPQAREMSTQARVVESGIRDAKQRVETQAPLTEKPEQAQPTSLNEGLCRTEATATKAMETNALHLQREGNLTISSNNGIRMTSLQGLSITGANYFLGTATAILNNQTTTIASETIMNLTDLAINRVNGSSFTHIEDSHQVSSRNSISRSTETAQTIATRTFNHGVELNSNTGSTMVSTAGQGGHTVHSSGSIANYTDSSVITLSKDQITMGAGSPPTPVAPQSLQDTAESLAVEQALLDALNPSSSFIRMTTSGPDAGITSVTSGNSSTVSGGSSFNASSNSYSSSANTAAQVAGRQIMSGVMGIAGNPRSHVFHQGSMIITGRMIGGFPTIPIDLIQFPSAPALPPKPKGYSIEDLEKCLPSKYQKEEAPNEVFGISRTLGIDIDQMREQAGSLGKGNASTSTNPGETATEQDVNTPDPNNPDSTKTNSSLEKDAAALGSSIANLLIATGAGGGPTNIFLDQFDSKSGKVMTSPNADGSTTISGFNPVSSITESDATSIALDMAKGTNYQSFLDSYLPQSTKEEQDIISRLDSSSWREIVIRDSADLTNLDPITSITNSIKASIDPADLERLNPSFIDSAVGALTKDYEAALSKYSVGGTKAINVKETAGQVAGYAQFAQGVADSLGISIDIPGIGAVTSIITNGIAISEDVNSIIEKASTGPLDLGDIASAAGGVLSKLGVSSNITGQLGSLTSIAELIQSNPNSGLLELARSSSIQSSITSLVPSEYQSYISSIGPILNSLQSGQSIDRAQVTQALESALGASGLSSNELVQSLSPLLDNIASGKEINLSDPSVVSSLDSVLGGGKASKLLAAYQEAKSIASNIEALTAIPDLLSLMNDRDVPLLSQMGVLVSCLDLFNKIKQIINSFKSIKDSISSLGLGGGSDESDDEKPSDTSIIKEAKQRRRRRKQLARVIESSLPTIEPEEELVTTSDEYLATTIALAIKEVPPTQVLTVTNRVIDTSNRVVIVENSRVLVLDTTPRVINTSTDPTIENLVLTTPPSITLYPSEVAQVWSNSAPTWTSPLVEIRDNLVVSVNTPPTTRSVEYLPSVISTIRKDRTSTDVEAANFFQSMPYLSQFIRLLDDYTYEEILSINNLGPYQEAVDDLIILKDQVTLPSDKGFCFAIPKLNNYTSTVSVTSVSSNSLVFTTNASLAIGFNTPLQLCIKQYTRSSDALPLSVLQDPRQFNPCIINYRVIKYSPSLKQGTAILDSNNLLTLESLRGELFQYSLLDIGSRIIPTIERAYLPI